MGRPVVESEIKLDPALAGKPFPGINSPADKVKPKAPGFPGVNSAGDRKGP